MQKLLKGQDLEICETVMQVKLKFSKKTTKTENLHNNLKHAEKL